MKGCRPLSDEEITACLAALERHRFSLRDRALFVVGCNTGFRISELLSLTVGDLLHNGQMVDEIYVARRHMKKKREGRGVPFLNPDARALVQLWLNELAAQGHGISEGFLFRSREGGNKAIGRRQAWCLLKKAFAACGFTGKLATHTMRKTFARKMRSLLGEDLPALQQAMGHKDINSTMQYVQFDEKKLKDAFRKI